jgi:hypothetical protein
MRTATTIMSAMLLVLAVAAPSQASDRPRQPVGSQPAPAFKDLPGVQSQQERLRQAQAAEPRCTTEVEYRRWRRGSAFPDFPVQVYRCEQNGAVYTGTQLPDRPWVPGLNPHSLPRD